MNNTFRTMSYVCFVAISSVVMIGAAMAQSLGNGQLQTNRLMEKFSAADVSSMLQGLEIVTALQPYENDDSATMTATTSGGGLFIISMFQCDDASVGLGCKQALVYTGLPNAGLSYEDLNAFHTVSDVTRAINIPEQQLVVFGTPIYSHGGIGRQHFQILTALFLNDMQGYVNQQNASATSVAMKFIPSIGKTQNMAAREAVPTPALELVGNTNKHALGAALSNTWNVEFLTDEAAKLVSKN